MTLTIYKACVLAALVLSIAGYGALYKRSRLPVCFFPVTLVSGVSVVLYGFGFFSALKIGCYAILAVGIMLLILCRKGFNAWAFFSDFSMLFCLVAGVWLYAITREAFLSHWDDGSHWYRICKAIYTEGAFPTTPDILYYNYVPGCQLWVYFVLRFVDFSQANCMFAQGLINIACVAALFAGASGAKSLAEKGFLAVVTAAAGVVLCCMSTGTYALLVDLQLGLVAMALLILLLDQGNSVNSLIPAFLLFAFLLLIKNSAVFFALMIFLWAALAHRWRGKRLALRTMLLLLVPLALRMAYSVRADIVYSGAELSPQTMSVDRFLGLFAQKEASDVLLFTDRFLYKLIIGDTGLSRTVYVCAALLVFLWVCFRGAKKMKEAAAVRRNLLFGLGMTGLYAVMLYAMYIFSMTTSEMVVVNSFYRYYGSMVIVFAGMVVYTSMTSLASTEIAGVGVQRTCLMGMLLFAVLALHGAYPARYILGRSRANFPDHYGPSFWRTMEYNIPENRSYSGLHYVLFWDPADFSDCVEHEQYAGFAAGAWMRSEKVDVISRKDIHQGLSQAQMDAIEHCDQLIFMSDMTPEAELLAPYMDVSDLTIGLKYKQ